jgi:hypothetical protein
MTKNSQLTRRMQACVQVKQPSRFEFVETGANRRTPANCVAASSVGFNGSSVEARQLRTLFCWSEVAAMQRWFCARLRGNIVRCVDVARG